MNENEQKIAKALQDRGFEVLRNGWPDFLVMSKEWDRGFCMEYKHHGDKVRPEQKRMHLALARFGIPTLIGTPDFAEILKKRGKAIVLPEDYKSLKERMHAMKEEVKHLTERLNYCQESISAMPVLFEPISEQIQEMVDVGTIQDAGANNVQDAENRCLQRGMRRAIESLPNLSLTKIQGDPKCLI
jgi:hypothetical protein